MSRRKGKGRSHEDNGFAEWGGYMAAKVAKLQEQYSDGTCGLTKKQSDIFSGVAIFVNGYTTPSAEELKLLMAAHGGVYHHYQSSSITAGTTHIIASNLPNFKVKQMGNVPIVKANWITDSISADKLLDYRKYLLYTNQNRKQPTLDFPVVTKATNCDESTDVYDTANKPAEVISKLNDDVNSEPKPQTSNVKSHSSRTLTAADPRFLSEFYNNSRLHLISTLGAEYKQLVTQLREKSDGTFPGREKLKFLDGKHFGCNESVIMHIDMDCFFVSVGLRQRPELRGKPVAVTHAKNSQGPINRSENSMEAEYTVWKKYFPNDHIEKLDTHASMSEIASCSYEARKCGVRNGMFLGAAKKMCPDLQTIPYDFQGYREVSTTLYKTIATYTLDIEAVSCDEMYVDVTAVLREAKITVEQWATHIRKEIMDVTGCPCSTGFGANRLQARLATKKAKPAGQFYFKPHEVEEYISEVLLGDLPGVGHATVAKLNKMGLKTCGDVQMALLGELQAELGQKAGETISLQARGIDRKPLNFEHERKSVSADVNYGIRFKDKTEALNFLQNLSTEVCTRLQDIGMRARCLTLKLLVRAPEAPVETAKFLGCGLCNAINRSTTTGGLISDAATIYKEAKALYERANVLPMELRGVGIQLTRLEKAPKMNAALSRFLQQNSSEATGKNTENTSVENTSENNRVEASSIKNVVNEETKSRNVEQTTTLRPTVTTTITKPIKSKQKKPSTNIASKRGRPRGKTTTKSSTKTPVNNLKKYFKLPTPTPTVSPVSTNDIDINVLNELPEDLRKEIIREYGLEDKIVTAAAANIRHVEGDEQTKINEEATTSNQASPFDGLDWEELKPIVLNWLNSDSKPANVDVMMLADYFKKLAVDRKIEALKKMLSFLYRHVSKLGICTWHEAYLTIVNTMQEGMVARYGSTLCVDRRFVCAQHS